MFLCIQNLVQYLSVGVDEETTEILMPIFTSGHSRSISYTPALLQQLSPQQNQANFNARRANSPFHATKKGILFFAKINQINIFLKILDTRF